MAGIELLTSGAETGLIPCILKNYQSPHHGKPQTALYIHREHTTSRHQLADYIYMTHMTHPLWTCDLRHSIKEYRGIDLEVTTGSGMFW